MSDPKERAGARKDTGPKPGLQLLNHALFRKGKQAFNISPPPEWPCLQGGFSSVPEWVRPTEYRGFFQSLAACAANGGGEL